LTAIFKLKKQIQQLLLLDKEGVLKASCDSIFASKGYLNNSVLPYFPLVESVFPMIQKLQVNDPEVEFGAVETAFAKLPGIYDFSFIKMRASQSDMILWIIKDHTKEYKEKTFQQQLQNEMIIAKELLNRR